MAYGSSKVRNQNRAITVTYTKAEATPHLTHWATVGTLFFFGCTHGIHKFLGQGLNPYHSSDNARFLTCCTTEELRTASLSLTFSASKIDRNTT